MELDYQELGLKAGLEVHHELEPDNNHKLFCHCPAELREKEPDLEITRYQKAVPGEEGKIDVAALFEGFKDRKIVYQACSDSICEVELDEAPPLPLNQEALDIALQITYLLNAEPVNEVHVMRKTIVDGSLPSGFQRTATISPGIGYIETSDGRVRISEVLLEEDAARTIEKSKNKAVFRLDRLGIPEVEIGTKPDIKSPEQAKEAAKRIGKLVRATGKAKTGLGKIRQDVNVSIENGARAEIKHVQSLSMIPKVLKNEARRQLKLLKIKEELEEREVKQNYLKPRLKNVSEVFKETESNLIKKNLKKGNQIFALKLMKFEGILEEEIQPDHSFGKEIADILKAKFGLGGILHTDELPGYGISIEEVEAVRERIGASLEDAVVIFLGHEDQKKEIAESIIKRAQQAFEGVQKEVRKANPDGTTTYLRPLPGAARLYPETDLMPTEITEERKKRIKENLPRTLEERKEVLERKGLNEELIDQLLNSDKLDLFDEITTELGVEEREVASILLNEIPRLRSEGLETSNIREEHIKEFFKLIGRGKISKDSLKEIMRVICEKPNKTVSQVVERRGLRKMGKQEVKEVVRKIVRENEELIKEKGERAISILMGEAMKKLEGKASGSLVSKLLKREMERYD